MSYSNRFVFEFAKCVASSLHFLTTNSQNRIRIFLFECFRNFSINFVYLFWGSIYWLRCIISHSRTIALRAKDNRSYRIPEQQARMAERTLQSDARTERQNRWDLYRTFIDCLYTYLFDFILFSASVKGDPSICRWIGTAYASRIVYAVSRVSGILHLTFQLRRNERKKDKYHPTASTERGEHIVRSSNLFRCNM